MGEVGEWNLSCAFPGSLGCAWTWSCAVWQSPVVDRNLGTRASQVMGSLLMPSILVSGTSSSAGWLGFHKTPKMLPLLLVWKAFVTVLLKSVCSWEMFWWFGVFSIGEKVLLRKKVCPLLCDVLLHTDYWNPAGYNMTNFSWQLRRWQNHYQSWIFSFLLKLQLVSKSVPCLFMEQETKHSERLWLASN